MMRFYHQTTPDAAAGILSEGFRDGRSPAWYGAHSLTRPGLSWSANGYSGSRSSSLVERYRNGEGWDIQVYVSRRRNEH
jgi:hypothetical protein